MTTAPAKPPGPATNRAKIVRVEVDRHYAAALGSAQLVEEGVQVVTCAEITRAQYGTETPTHSRGRPALPAYRYLPTVAGCYPPVVDYSRVVDRRCR